MYRKSFLMDETLYLFMDDDDLTPEGIEMSIYACEFMLDIHDDDLSRVDWVDEDEMDDLPDRAIMDEEELAAQILADRLVELDVGPEPEPLPLPVTADYPDQPHDVGSSPRRPPRRTAESVPIVDERRQRAPRTKGIDRQHSDGKLSRKRRGRPRKSRPASGAKAPRAKLKPLPGLIPHEKYLLRNYIHYMEMGTSADEIAYLERQVRGTGVRIRESTHPSYESNIHRVNACLRSVAEVLVMNAIRDKHTPSVKVADVGTSLRTLGRYRVTGYECDDPELLYNASRLVKLKQGWDRDMPGVLVPKRFPAGLDADVVVMNHSIYQNSIDDVVDIVAATNKKEAWVIAHCFDTRRGEFLFNGGSWIVKGYGPDAHIVMNVPGNSTTYKHNGWRRLDISNGYYSKKYHSCLVWDCVRTFTGVKGDPNQAYVKIWRMRLIPGKHKVSWREAPRGLPKGWIIDRDWCMLEDPVRKLGKVACPYELLRSCIQLACGKGDTAQVRALLRDKIRAVMHRQQDLVSLNDINLIMEYVTELAIRRNYDDRTIEVREDAPPLHEVKAYNDFLEDKHQTCWYRIRLAVSRFFYNLPLLKISLYCLAVGAITILWALLLVVAMMQSTGLGHVVFWSPFFISLAFIILLTLVSCCFKNWRDRNRDPPPGPGPVPPLTAAHEELRQATPFPDAVFKQVEPGLKRKPDRFEERFGFKRGTLFPNPIVVTGVRVGMFNPKCPMNQETALRSRQIADPKAKYPGMGDGADPLVVKCFKQVVGPLTTIKPTPTSFIIGTRSLFGDELHLPFSHKRYCDKLKKVGKLKAYLSKIETFNRKQAAIHERPNHAFDYSTFAKNEKQIESVDLAHYTKVEALKPRVICALNANEKVLFCSFFSGYGELMKKLYDKRQPFCFSSGMTLDDLDDFINKNVVPWTDDCQKSGYNVLCFTTDLSKFDASQNPAYIAVENEVIKDAAVFTAPKIDSYIFDGLKKVWLRSRLRTRIWGEECYCEVPGTRKSGQPDTTLHNTIMAYATVAAACYKIYLQWCRDARIRPLAFEHFAKEYVRVMVAGDDVIGWIAVPEGRRFDSELLSKHVLTHGHKLKFVHVTPFDLDETSAVMMIQHEFCSKRIYPITARKYAFGGKPGRLLAKLSWSDKIHESGHRTSPARRLEHLAGSLLSIRRLVSAVPGMREIVERYLALLNGVEPEIPQRFVVETTMQLEATYTQLTMTAFHNYYCINADRLPAAYFGNWLSLDYFKGDDIGKSVPVEGAWFRLMAALDGGFISSADEFYVDKVVTLPESKPDEDLDRAIEASKLLAVPDFPPEEEEEGEVSDGLRERVVTSADVEMDIWGYTGGIGSFS